MTHIHKSVSGSVQKPAKHSVMRLQPQVHRNSLDPAERGGKHHPTITALFRKIVLTYPDRIALVCGTRVCTYLELDHLSNRLARRLAANGSGSGRKIGLVAGRSIESVAAMLGILKSGSAYIPLDPGLPQKRLDFQLLESGADLVVTTEENFRFAVGQDAETLVFTEGCAWLNEWGPGVLEDTNRSEDLLYVIFTSGSTGEPKGAMVTHRNMVNYSQYMESFLGLTGESPLSFAHVSSFSADIGNTCLFPSLLSGGSLHILPKGVYTDPAGLEACFSREKIDVCKITPSHMKALLGSAGSPGVLPREFLIFGGEALDFDLVEAVGRIAPRLKVVNHYGPSETTVGVACTRMENIGYWKTKAATVPIGKPIHGAVFLVVDGGLKPMAQGEPGELLIGGECVGRGYVNRKDLTDAKFLDAIRSHPGMVFYRSGDLVRQLSDGTFEFLGRVDRQVKIRGYRVEVDELERCIRSHPGVKDAHVVAMIRPQGPFLTGFIIEMAGDENDGSLKARKMTEFLETTLPSYMIPSRFIFLTEFPLTLSGKVDQKALIRMAAEPEGIQMAGGGAGEGSRVSEIWKKTLKVHSVGLDEDFFSLGGDSIAAIMMSAEFQKHGMRIHPQTLLENPTVRLQTQILENHSAKERLLPANDDATGPFRLTPVQDRFFEQEFPQANHYNQSVVLVSKEEIDPDAASEGIRVLIGNHQALALAFRRSESGWVQEPKPFNIKRIVRHCRLEGIGEKEIELAEKLEAAAAQKRLSISKGVMVQAIFFHLGAGKGCKLFLTVHHLAVDGVSWRILLNEMEQLFAAHRAGKAFTPIREAVSLRQWIRALGRPQAKEKFSAEKAFWSTQDSGKKYALPWPDGGDPGLEAATETIWTCLDPAATTMLLGKVSSSVHVHEILLTALARAIRKWADARPVMIELEGHGRDGLDSDLDLSGTVGWFTSMYPITFDIDPERPFSESIAIVKDQLRKVPGTGLGYSVLNPETPARAASTDSAGSNPPSICFNYFGNYHESPDNDRFWHISGESLGATRGPKNPRTHYLKVTGRMLDGRLRMDWSFPDRSNAAKTVELLAESFTRELRGSLGFPQAAVGLDSGSGKSPQKRNHQSFIGYPYASPVFDPIRASSGPSPVNEVQIGGRRASSIFLTGATGFLGIHLLRQLLSETEGRIFCLVRGKGREDSRKRLESKLRWYFPGEDFSRVQDRIVVVPGDMKLPELGMISENYGEISKSVDMVVHSAADVRLVADQKELDQVNIGGMKRLLEFSDSGRQKAMHHVSTLSVFGSALSEGKRAFNEMDFEVGQDFRNHYERSKFESEKLVRKWAEFGKRALIFRSSHIAANSWTGRFQENIADNRLFLSLRTSLRIGMAPFKPFESMRFSYVDIVAKGIARLAFHESGSGTYHVENPNTLSHYDYFRALQSLGFPILILNESDYVQNTVKYAESGAFGLETVWGHGGGVREAKDSFDCRKTVEILASLGVTFKRPGMKWLRSVIQHCIERKFIAPPRKWKAISTPPEILSGRVPA